MKTIKALLVLIIVLPSLVFANPHGATCGVKGQSDFTVAFDVWGTDAGRSVTLDQGSHGYVLWYTDAQQISSEYSGYERVFNEPNLISGGHYSILITHDEGTKELNYYRKLYGESDNAYALIGYKQNFSMESGQHWVISAEVSGIQCSDEIETPLPPTSGQVCDVFNTTVQTWFDSAGNGNGRLYISGSAQIKGADIDALTGKRMVGFDEDQVFGDLTGPGPDSEQRINTGCDNERCWGDSSLKVPKQVLTPFPASSNTGNTWVGDQQEWSGGGQVQGVLGVGNGGVLTLKTGVYWVDRIELNASGKIVVPEGEKVILNVKEMNISGFLGMDITDIENNSQYDGYLRVNVYDLPVTATDIKVDFNGSATFIGLLYSEASDSVIDDAVQLSGTSTIYGAVTSVNLELNSTAQIIASSSCLEPSISDSDYEIEVTPSAQLALMCGTDLPTFEILTTNDSVAESSSVSLSIPNADVSFTLNAATGSGSTCTISSASDTCQFSSNSNGVLVVTAAANSSNAALASSSYNLLASMVEDTSRSQQVSFSFVPYKFDIKPHSESQWSNQVIPLIANKAASIDIRVLACSAGDSSSPTVINYNKTLDSSALSVTLTEPASGSGNISIGDISFSGGQTGSDGVQVMFDESGEARVVIKDSDFSCSNFDALVDPDTGKCPIEGETLQGVFTLKARPWKFAVCPLDSNQQNVVADGTSKGGSAFVAAGEPFSVLVTPIKYSSPECNEQEQVTQNYFQSEASVELSYSLDSPSNGKLGILNGTRARKVTEDEQKNVGYIFSDLTYTEVGSIELSALETGVFYSSIEVDREKGVSGERTIGRFYPEHFKITKTTWDYPDTQEDASYIYMEQKFDLVQFDVSAFSSKDELTQNYALFSDAYKVNFELSGDYAERLNIDDESEFNKSDWSGAVWSKSWSNSIEWSKLALPDGPFNSGIGEKTTVTKIGLSIRQEKNELKDPSQFKYIQKVDGETEKTTTSNTQSLLSQPDVRYGRINLDDVGGKSGSRLTVPLRVEYWNGIRFVRHADDGGTTIEAELEKQTVIWPGNEVGCDVIVEVVDDDVTKSEGYNTISDAQVDQGTLPNDLNERLLAHQDCSNPPRQQSQVWLDLDANGLPWLKYDWDNDGEEENPSSVVTFGIHRGNDRVIYRGEPGLTAQ